MWFLGGGGGGEKYIMLHFLRHKGVRCSADTGRSDGAGSGDGVLRPECANGHQMSWQLCGTKMRKESLELGDVSASRPRQARLPSPKQPRKELLRKQISSLPFPRSYCKQPRGKTQIKDVQEMSLSCAKDVPCCSLERLHLPPTDPVAHGSDGRAATGAWPRLLIDRAKERAAVLYFKEADKAQYPLHVFPWPLVEILTGFKNLLHIKLFFCGLMRGWKTDFQAHFHITGAYANT